MALEDAIAKYEIQVTRSGDGATQSIQDFKDLDSAVQSASTSAAAYSVTIQNVDSATKNASTSLGASSVALTKLRESSLLAREGMSGLNDMARLTGGAGFQSLQEGSIAARAGLMAIRTAAMLTGASLETIIPVFGLIAAAVGAGVLIWNSYRDEMKKTQEQAKSMADALEKMPALVSEISHLAASGLVSPEQSQKWMGQLGRINAPTALPPDYNLFGPGQPSAAPYSSPSYGKIDASALGMVTPDAVSDVQKQMLQAGLMDANNRLDPQIEALEKLKELQESLSTETLEGYDKERAEAEQNYQAKLAQINQLAAVAGQKFSASQKAGLESDATAAYTNQMAGIGNKEDAENAAARMKQIEQQITLDSLQEDGKRYGAAEDYYAKRTECYEQLKAAGMITEDQYTSYVFEAEKKLQEGLNAEDKAAVADAVANKKAEEQEILAAIQARDEQSAQMTKQFNDDEKLYELTSKDDKNTVLQQELQDRLDFDGRMAFDYRITLDEMNEMDDQALIKYQEGLNSMEKKEQLHTMTMAQMENQAAQDFASGFSNAFVSFIDGTKSAEQAFAEFAASFLEQIAQMIMQQMVLNTIKSALFGGGGIAVAGAASGGISPTMAATGIAGVSSVSSPTYFPKFNVVAGEAGSEALTVLARPRMMDIGGMQAVVGQAGNQTLAVANANVLAAGPGVSGTAIIQIQPAPGYEATIVSSAIQGAVLKVTSDLGQYTPLRQAVKQANA